MQILTNELARIQTKFNHPEATVPTSIQSQCEGFNTDVNILIGPGSENTCLRGGGGWGGRGLRTTQVQTSLSELATSEISIF